MIQLRCQVPAHLEDLFEDMLWQWQATSVATPAQHQKDRVLTAMFLELDQISFRNALERSLQAWDAADVALDPQFEAVAEDNWQESWRASFQPLQAGSYTILPEWMAEDGADEKTILVYPGQAFGTGQHATTRLMIEAMERHDFENKQVIDVGCGTGILSIAADKMGAGGVFGFDIDPDCAENMQHHLEINQAQRVTLTIGDMTDFTLLSQDIILANITINVLSKIWPSCHRLLRPGGLLICSGILEDQIDNALVRLNGLDFEILNQTQEGEWCAIEARKL